MVAQDPKLRDTWAGRWPCRCETITESPSPRYLHLQSENICVTCGALRPESLVHGLWPCYCPNGNRREDHYVRLQPRDTERCGVCGTKREEVL